MILIRRIAGVILAVCLVLPFFLPDLEIVAFDSMSWARITAAGLSVAAFLLMAGLVIWKQVTGRSPSVWPSMVGLLAFMLAIVMLDTADPVVAIILYGPLDMTTLGTYLTNAAVPLLLLFELGAAVGDEFMDNAGYS